MIEEVKVEDVGLRDQLITIVNSLSQEQAALEDVLTTLKHIKLLAIEASSDYVTLARREAIQTEIQSLINQIDHLDQSE